MAEGCVGFIPEKSRRLVRIRNNFPPGLRLELKRFLLSHNKDAENKKDHAEPITSGLYLAA